MPKAGRSRECEDLSQHKLPAAKRFFSALPRFLLFPGNWGDQNILVNQRSQANSLEISARSHLFVGYTFCCHRSGSQQHLLEPGAGLKLRHPLGVWAGSLLQASPLIGFTAACTSGAVRREAMVQPEAPRYSPVLRKSSRTSRQSEGT